MKRILLFIGAFLLLFAGTTFTAVTWWTHNLEITNNSNLQLGHGVKLTLYDQVVINQGKLVPFGSYYSTKEGFVTEYEINYTLNIEGIDDVLDLMVSLNDLKIGDLYYDNSMNIHGPLLIDISYDDVVGEQNSNNRVEFANTSIRFNKVLVNEQKITISIRFSLLDNDIKYLSASDLNQAYDNLAGKKISFNLIFEVLIEDEVETG